jgi:hypothetical protein
MKSSSKQSVIEIYDEFAIDKKNKKAREQKSAPEDLPEIQT